MTNAFDTSGSSKIGKELEHNARNSRKGAKMVEKLRADGKEPMYIGLTKKPMYDKAPKEVLIKKGKV